MDSMMECMNECGNTYGNTWEYCNGQDVNDCNHCMQNSQDCEETQVYNITEFLDDSNYEDDDGIFVSDFDNYGFRGRGGTTFEPVFDWIEKEVLNLGQRPDALFYLTDGYAHYGMHEPPYQVMWISLTHLSYEKYFGILDSN